MNPREIYHRAVRAGIESAVKRVGMGTDPEALNKFYGAHPEFAEDEVLPLLIKGAEEDKEEVLALARIMGAFGVFDWGDGSFVRTDGKE